MSTRSTIWKKNKDGSLKGAYCHSGGGLNDVGAILLTAFGDETKVDKLLTLGNLSSLGANIEPMFTTREHSFANRQEDTCCFYARDRGDDLSGFILTSSSELDDFLEGFIYMYDETGKWYYLGDDEDEWIELTREVILSSWSGKGYLYPLFAIECLKDDLAK